MDKLDELKSFAGKYCIDIFELFDEIEIHEQLTPIRDAWETGRELSALIAEETSCQGNQLRSDYGAINYRGSTTDRAKQLGQFSEDDDISNLMGG
jgi:hypothetical protein